MDEVKINILDSLEELMEERSLNRNIECDNRRLTSRSLYLTTGQNVFMYI